MAIRSYTGFDAGGTNQCSATSGTFSVQNTTARNSGYALRVNPTTTAVGYVELADLDSAGLNTTNGNAPDAYVNFYFRIATAPSSGNEEIFVARSSSANKCSVRLNSDRTLSFYNSAATLVATGATVLATNTWYLIGVYIGDGTTAPWRVEINGSTEISSAVSGTTNLLTANNARFRFGKVTNKNGNSVDFYYDDIIWDNAAFVGEHSQYCIAPDGDGASAQFTGGTGASNYTQVNEIPINDSTYIVSTGASQRHLCTLPSASSAGITGSILSLQVWLRFRDHGSSLTTSTTATVRIGSTNYDSGTANAATTIVTRNPIWNTNPNSGSAWTLSDFDNVEIGILENNANPTRCTTILGFVVFVPSSSTNVQVDADVISLAGSIAAPTIVEGTGATVAPSGDPQIKVQRGVTNFGASANSATASITTVGSLSNAFARVTNVVYYSGGPSAGTSTTRNVCDLGVTCVLTDTSTVTFNRSSNGAVEDVRVYWEVWEYVGPASGPNEFVVRYHDEIAYAHTNTSVDTAVTVTTLADCVPFITGIYNDITFDGLANGLFTAEMVNASGDQIRLTRSSAIGGGNVSVAVVEFTGSNWTVSANNTASTSTAGSPVSVAIGTTISDWSKAFIVSSMYTDSPNHGNADNMWNVWYDDSTHINWQLNVNANGTHYLVAHIVKNDLLDVQYLSSLIGGGSAPSTLAGGSGDPQTETYTISSYSGYAAVSNLQYTTVIATADEDDTETNFPRFAWNYRLTDTDTLEWWRSRSSSGGSGDWVAQIIDWVNVADSGTVDGSFTTNDPTVKAGVKVIADSISLAGSLPSPTVSADNNETITPAVISAIFTALDATVDTGTTVSITADIISGALAIQAPTTKTSVQVSADIQSLVSSIAAPTIVAENTETVAAGFVSLVGSILAPTITTVNNETVAANSISLVGSILAPTVSAVNNETISAGVTSITGTILAVTTKTGVSVVANQVSLVGTILAPTITTVNNETISADFISLVGSIAAPTVATVDEETVLAGVLSLVSGVLAPTVTTVNNETVVAEVTSVALSIQGSTVSTGVTISAGTISLVGTILTPTIAAVNNEAVSANSVSIAVNIVAPTLKAGAVFAANANTISASILTPTVSAIRSPQISAGVIVCTGSVGAPVLRAGCIFVATELSVATNIVAPTTSTSVTVSANSISLVGNVLGASVGNATIVSPNTLGIAGTILAPTFQLSITQSPTAISLAGSILAPSITTVDSETVAVGVVGIQTSILAPSVTAIRSPIVSTTEISSTLSVVTPAINVSATITPNAVSLTSSIGAPSITTVDSETVAVNPLSISLNALAPTISASNTISIGTISLTSSLETPAVDTISAVRPAQIEATLSIGDPSISASVAVSSGYISAPIDLPVPTLSTSTTVSANTLVLSGSIQAPQAKVSISVSSETTAATFELLAPTIVAIRNISYAANAISLASSIPAPILVVNDNERVIFGTFALSFSAQAPQIRTSVSTQPNAITVSATPQFASVNTGVKAAAGVVVLDGTISVPNIIQGSGVSTSAPIVSGSFSATDPNSVNTSVGVTPNATSITGTIQTPVIYNQGFVIVAANAASGTFSVPAPFIGIVKTPVSVLEYAGEGQIAEFIFDAGNEKYLHLAESEEYEIVLEPLFGKESYDTDPFEPIVLTNFGDFKIQPK